jgi:hypothetical protein
MDDYLQIVLNSSRQANSYQLILLAAEGVALCLVCVIWVWVLLKKVAGRRFTIFSLLMVRYQARHLLGICLPLVVLCCTFPCVC